MQMFKVKGQRSRSQRNLSAAKRYNTAMDRFGDTNLAHGVVVKAGKGWRGSGGRSGRPSTNHSSSDKTRLNDLSYGIKIWTNLSSVLLQYWPLTDGQTDTFLIARPRWHSMQQNDMRETEGKKKEGWPP